MSKYERTVPFIKRFKEVKMKRQEELQRAA